MNGRALLVGGAVRDLLLSLDGLRTSGGIKDLDIEVHGLTIEQLQQILSHFGQVSLVGKSFGVLRLHGLISIGRCRVLIVPVDIQK